MHDVFFRHTAPLPNESASRATGAENHGQILNCLTAVKLREGVDDMSEPRFQVQRKTQPLHIMVLGRCTCREIQDVFPVRFSGGNFLTPNFQSLEAIYIKLGEVIGPIPNVGFRL